MSLKSKLADEINEEIRTKRRKVEELRVEFESSKRKLHNEINQLKSEFNELSAINRLPIELQCMIFGQLDVKDLFSCELVCKRWQQIVLHGLNVRKLVIIRRMKQRPRTWYYSDERCAPNRMILRSDLNFNVLESSFLFGIKQLKICNTSDGHIRPMLVTDTNFINRLTSLEVLEIKRFEKGWSNPEQWHIITLPNLQHLTIEHLSCRIKLNTPNLVSYQSACLNNNVNFIYPLKITRLCVGRRYKERFIQLDPLCLAMFKNLDTLCVDVSECWSYLKKRFFDHLELKELQIYPRFADTDKVRLCLAQLLALKQQPGRTSMRILFAGVPIEHIEQLADYDLNGPNMVRFHLCNYSKLHANNLRWLNELDYSGLVECVQKRIVDALPSDFHRKFGQVKRVVVRSAPQRPEHLIGFLKEFRNLQALAVLTPLDKTLFARLATECLQIWSLEVQNEGKRQNVDFIFKFRNLYHFSVDFPLKPNFIRKTFTAFECFRLDHGSVDYGDIETILKRKHGQRIEVFDPNLEDWRKEFADLDEYLCQLKIRSELRRLGR